MARKKKVDLSALDGVLNGLGYTNPMGQEEPADVTNILDNGGIENLDNQNTTSNIQTSAEDDEKDDFDDNSDIPDNVLNQNKNTSNPDDDPDK